MATSRLLQDHALLGLMSAAFPQFVGVMVDAVVLQADDDAVCGEAEARVDLHILIAPVCRLERKGIVILWEAKLGTPAGSRGSGLSGSTRSMSQASSATSRTCSLEIPEVEQSGQSPPWTRLRMVDSHRWPRGTASGRSHIRCRRLRA